MGNRPDALYFFSPYCLLRPTTNRIFDVRLADAFSGQGLYSEIIYPYTYMKDNIRQDQIDKFYGVNHSISTRMQYTPLLENSGRWWRVIILLTAFFLTSFRILIRESLTRRRVYIISRDVNILLPAIFLKKLFGPLFRSKIVYMAPEVKSGRVFRFVLKHADGIIAGTTLSRERIRLLVPVPEHKFSLSLAPVPEYTNDVSKTEARRKINYTSDAPLVVYTGKLGMDVHEVKYILQTASLLPQYNFLFTGGRNSAVEKVRSYCNEHNIGNVILTGFLADSTFVRNYQLAADVLVSYYTSKDHMVEYNYPQKINEYLSTGNPVITPDFPATSDVLNDTNVYFVAPDDPAALAAGIKDLVEDKELSARLSAGAKRAISSLSFPKRAAVWKAFLEKL